MNIFWKNFIYSLRLPQKKAVFSLNRIGMDITVIYMFILIAVTSIPAFFEQLQSNKLSEVPVEPFFFFIFFFSFYYLVLVIIIFCLLSAIGYVATVIAKILGRRLRFSLMWKMAASASTIPLFVYTIVALFYPLSQKFLLLAIVYIMYVIIKIIFIYPIRKKR